ncbi:DNA repair protein RecO [Zymomonas mobilis]|uniref:DNA repair protein RecO n=1 Tax=Zymomonas mobilis subsp. pomaceae (strain ATCC 29192 / DSM 22645 / JCM 10191 / CCUG 17912 / NBRC 13757 / NCIMB 11200 / NRRL B-4491 / Barker I) TaxID=579138 RepID=F8EVY2_ZYMMT|nr:DNA repair protein RecO [Zymomonas mobilis]AEI37459.1 DNA repair protein RecO [Zymomonas mobilis subsp. pomaceae ATCC 29192]MDX5948826.1 DNA repair protein RecO [Zymomonas mobilis subsp. pomaceae]GEB88634.1 DNA repair protein RecO [Zymomonas mobilis subsp. pomaceae]
MSSVSTSSLLLTSRPHGESGAVIRFLTEKGLQAGYVQGAKSRHRRPLLLAGNQLQASWRNKAGYSLPSIQIELLHSRASMITDPLRALVLGWICPFTASILPEAQPEPRIFSALNHLLNITEKSIQPIVSLAELVRFELLLLSELGYGLSLSRCIFTGKSDNLTWVSPKHHAAVSQQVAQGHEAKLLPLPQFLQKKRGHTEDHIPDWLALQKGLRLSGFFLNRHFNSFYHRRLFSARDRLIRHITKFFIKA